MKIFELIDYIQRRINSILFRIILITFSILILSIYDGLFSKVYYSIGIVLYFLIYISLLKHHKLRLFNDLIFMIFILIGKNPNEILLFTFLILPAINSINFSGNRRSLLLYLYLFIIYDILLCFYNHRFEIDFVYDNIIPLYGLIFIWLIDLYTSLRIKIRDFRETINEVVESFYLDKETIKKPHKIYKTLIETINKKIKKELIEDLFCFTVNLTNERKLIIVNGSKFIWEYEFLDEKIVEKIASKKYILNTPLLIDNERYEKNLIILIEIEGYEYIFVFITKIEIPLYYLLIGFFRSITPALSKISKILLSEKRLQEVRNDELLKLTERRQYVNRATKTMHFIRNRLGPIANLIKMVENSDSIPSDKSLDFKLYLKNEADRAKIELSNITERANYLLEKSNNPFNFSITSRYSIEKIFSTLKRNFLSYFPSDEIKITDNSLKEKKHISINEEGFELFLSDWLNNVKKYKKANSSVEIIIENQEIKIIFKNDFLSSITEIKRMITDLMSNDRNEIMKRTTHGLFQIKTTLEDMQIPFIVSLNDDKSFVIFEITLKILENEDSNI